MSKIDERLDRGVEIFRRAGDDGALLGAALLAFHGALEEYLDEELRALPQLDAAERRQLEAGRLGWVARARLAEQAALLTKPQCGQALEATRARLALARGDGCGWDAAAVQSYGKLVATRCGRRELLRWIDQRAERSKKTLAHPAPGVWAPPARRFPLLRVLLTLLFLAALAAVGWTLYQQIDGPRLLRALGALPAPTAEPLPTEEATLTPLPPQRSARMTGLGGGPGWLHASPSFDSPTRAIRLSDGMQVTLRDQQQTDSSGTRWQLVEAGGYEGWCPEANLAIDQR